MLRVCAWCGLIVEPGSGQRATHVICDVCLAHEAHGAASAAPGPDGPAEPSGRGAEGGPGVEAPPREPLVDVREREE